jgi:uncharacterized protein (TIGR02001 family)
VQCSKNLQQGDRVRENAGPSNEAGPRDRRWDEAAFQQQLRKLPMLTSVRSFLAAAMLAGSALAATPAFAQDASPVPAFTVTGNVAVVSDYRFRGVSLSAGDPAVQGGITLNHSSGFYVGAWSSSIDGGPLYGEQELDLYGGWTGDVASGVTVDVGLLKYVYPTNDVGPADYWEPYASVATQLGPVHAKLGVAYAWDQDSLGNEDNLYIYTNVDLGVPNTPVTVSGHLGYTDGVLAPPLLAGTGDDSGFDWSLGGSVTVLPGLSLGGAYIGTEGPSIDGFTDDTLVATLTFSM